MVSEYGRCRQRWRNNRHANSHCGAGVGWRSSRGLAVTIASGYGRCRQRWRDNRHANIHCGAGVGWRSSRRPVATHGLVNGRGPAPLGGMSEAKVCVRTSTRRRYPNKLLQRDTQHLQYLRNEHRMQILLFHVMSTLVCRITV